MYNVVLWPLCEMVCRKESSTRRQCPSDQHWGSPPTTSSHWAGVWRPDAETESFHTLTEKSHYVGILFFPQNAGEHNIAAFVTLIQIVWPYFFNISYFFIFSQYFPLHYLKSYWSIKSNQGVRFCGKKNSERMLKVISQNYISSQCCCFEFSINQKILKNLYHGFHTKILFSTTVFNIDNNNKCLEWYLKDHVTLKTEVMMLNI